MSETKTPRAIHVLAERIAPTHWWIEQPDGLFNTDANTLTGYSFADRTEIFECQHPAKKNHNPALCLAARSSRFEAAWTERRSGFGAEARFVKVTCMVSAGELHRVFESRPLNLRIKALNEIPAGKDFLL